MCLLTLRDGLHLYIQIRTTSFSAKYTKFSLLIHRMSVRITINR